MARGRRTYTRMEKSIQENFGSTPSPTGADFWSYQLEGGQEECQIKRIVASLAISSSSELAQFKLGLFQDAPSSAADFTDDKIIYSFAATTGQQMINETTTVRVPRGWHIGALVFGVTTTSYFSNVQLNYLVLS